MIVCPNCSHSNPEGAQACEACYTPLPATTNCPNCGATVQADADFCGQCGFHLHLAAEPVAASNVPPTLHPGMMPEPAAPDPFSSPAVASTQVVSASSSSTSNNPTPMPATVISEPNEPVTGEVKAPTSHPIAATPVTSEVTSGSTGIQAPPHQPQAAASAKTQLQQQTAQLFHVQTDTLIELPPNLSLIHLGKTNDRVPPDIDVAGFPNSEVVSRIHADIRVEGDSFYIEDTGSSNGTYINNMPLLPGNRHRLRPGDRIALGKGDLVTFLFQIS